MQQFDKVLQEKISFRLTHLKHKKIFLILQWIYIFPNMQSHSNHCTFDHKLQQVTDLNQYLNQHLIEVEQLMRGPKNQCN